MNQQISTGKKLSYAMGGMSMNLTNLVISQWLFFLFVPDKKHALVPASLFGIYFMLGRVTDAVTDPLIGYWSDHLKSKRGRRIPFILWGLLPFALVYFLLWTPPIGHEHWINSVYIIIMIQLYFILYTVVITPYLALIPELSSDLKERINITTMQAVFVMIGTLIFGLMGIIVKKGGFVTLGIMVSLLTIVSFAPTVLAIKEKEHKPQPEREKANVIKWVAMTLKNRPFLYLVVSTSFYWFGLNLLLMLIPFWVKNYLNLKVDAVAMLMLPFLGMNVVFFFVFNYLSKKFGKYIMFIITLLGTAISMPLLCTVGYITIGSKLVQSAITMAIIGIPVAGFMMLPFALLSDVVDYDEQLTRQRREGIYFGVQAIFQKTMIGLSIFAFGLVAYIGGEKVATEFGLKLVMVVAAMACLLGFLSFLKYPIREREGKIHLIGLDD